MRKFKVNALAPAGGACRNVCSFDAEEILADQGCVHFYVGQRCIGTYRLREGEICVEHVE